MDGSSENQSVKSTKRQWTAEEDAVLVQGLLKLVDDGWKADAGSFKPGYTKVLEKYIHNKFPGCTLKANPHIESRVKRLKSQYSAIKDMLGPSASGFGWDDTRKMIIVEKEIYSQWCKVIREIYYYTFYLFITSTYFCIKFIFLNIFSFNVVSSYCNWLVWKTISTL
jgi:hypothetical protein